MPRRRRSVLTRLLHGLASGGREVFGAQARQLQRESLLGQAGEQRGELREEDFRRTLALAGIDIPTGTEVSLQDVAEQIRQIAASKNLTPEQREAIKFFENRGAAAGTLAGQAPPPTLQEIEEKKFAGAKGSAAGTRAGGEPPLTPEQREEIKFFEGRGSARGTKAGGPTLEEIRERIAAERETPEEIQEGARRRAVGKAEGTPASTTVSEAQRDARGRLGILETAEVVAARIEVEGAPLIRSNLPDYLNFLRGPKGRQYRQAVRTIGITSLKTLFPGALSDQEREAGIGLIMPAPFDDPGMVKQKADIRRKLIDLVRLKAGGQVAPAGQEAQMLSFFKGAGVQGQPPEPPDPSVLDPAVLQAFIEQNGDPFTLTLEQLRILSPERGQ